MYYWETLDHGGRFTDPSGVFDIDVSVTGESFDWGDLGDWYGRIDGEPSDFPLHYTRNGDQWYLHPNPDDTPKQVKAVVEWANSIIREETQIVTVRVQATFRGNVMGSAYLGMVEYREDSDVFDCVKEHDMLSWALTDAHGEANRLVKALTGP